jgi:cell division septation protein DedD
LNLGRTQVYAFFRTSLYHEFYNQILYDQSLVEEMLFSYLNIYEISLKHTLKNDHTIGFRFRGASGENPSGVGPGSDQIGLVEYSIPLGVPVARNKDLGELKGRVYDWNTKQGLGGVILKINDRTVATNSRGEFLFHSLTEDEYFLDVIDGSLGPNLVPQMNIPLSLMISGGEKKELDIAVLPGARLTGTVEVSDISGESQIPAIQLSLESDPSGSKKTYGLKNTLIELRGNQNIYRRVTDDRGTFSFNGLRPGTWELKIFDNSLPELFKLEKDQFTFELESGSEEKVRVKVVPRQRQIRMVNKGAIPVKSAKGEILSRPKPEAEPMPEEEKRLHTESYYVQVASCLLQDSVEDIEGKLHQKYQNLYVTQVRTPKETYHVVRIRTEDEESAKAIVEKLEADGLGSGVYRRGNGFILIYSKSQAPEESPSIPRASQTNRPNRHAGLETEYVVQVATCLFLDSAQNIRHRLLQRQPGLNVQISATPDEVYRVVQVHFRDRVAAMELTQWLIGEGFSDPIIRIHDVLYPDTESELRPSVPIKPINRSEAIENLNPVLESFRAPDRKQTFGNETIETPLHSTDEHTNNPRITVQVASCKLMASAESIASRLRESLKDVAISTVQTGSGPYFVIRIDVNSMEAAQQTVHILKDQGFDPLILERMPE